MNQKIAYIKWLGQHQLFDGFSMTICLIENIPYLLQIEEELIEMLLKVEEHVKNTKREIYLMIHF